MGIRAYIKGSATSMPAAAPDDITGRGERELWWRISKLYEIYLGTDESLWDERTREFQVIISRINRMLDEGRKEGIQEGRSRDGGSNRP